MSVGQTCCMDRPQAGQSCVCLAGCRTDVHMQGSSSLLASVWDQLCANAVVLLETEKLLRPERRFRREREACVGALGL